MNAEVVSIVTLGLVLLAPLITGGIYAALFAAGVDAPLPARLLRFVWRGVVWFVTGFVIAVLLLGSTFSSLAAIDVSETRLSLIFIPLGIWVVGSLALISVGKPRRVVPFLFATTGLGYVFGLTQIVLSTLAADIAAPPEVGLPVFVAYCAATGMVLHGLMQPATNQTVRWLAIAASIALISGSLMIGPAVLLADDPEGVGYRTLVASAVWSATALSVWSVGTAALLTAGRGTGTVVAFLCLSVTAYITVLLVLIGAAGAPGRVLLVLALVAVNSAAIVHVWQTLTRNPAAALGTSSIRSGSAWANRSSDAPQTWRVY